MTNKSDHSKNHLTPSLAAKSTANQIEDLAAVTHARNMIELKLVLDEFSKAVNFVRTRRLPPLKNGGEDAK